MRVTEAFQILSDNLSRLEMPPTQPEGLHNGQQGYRYEGMSALVDAVDQLARVPGLEGECANLRQTTFFRSPSDSGVATTHDWNTLRQLVGELKNIATRVRHVLQASVETTDPNTIAIKLPPAQNLEELGRVIGELQMALGRPVQLVLHDHLRLEGMDRGSMWLMLVASAVGVVKFTFGLLLAANHYMRKQAELDRYLEGTKAITGLNEYVGGIEQNNAKLMTALGDSLTKQLLEGKPVDGEAVNTTLNAIKTLAELRKQGLEMQLSANAPKEVKDVFEQFVLRDMSVGELMPKLPLQLTAGSADSGRADPPELPIGDPDSAQ